MNHDTEAAWAAAEVVRCVKENPSIFYNVAPDSEDLTIYTGRETSNEWPIADGIIVIEGEQHYDLALEYKRITEGLHGLLTALGQSLAYIEKGFNASIIVIPNEYPSLNNPGDEINSIINTNNIAQPIGIFTYSEPDPDITSPFLERLNCERTIQLDTFPERRTQKRIKKISTQWAHLREGSSDPDAFYKYLLTAKTISGATTSDIIPVFPDELIIAVEEITEREPQYYLSYTIEDTLHERIWRNFWYSYVLHEETLPIWIMESDDTRIVNNVASRIFLYNLDRHKKFFVGRSDSIKNKLVRQLNADDISEEEAWKSYARNIHARAHSYREDLDSGLAHLGLLDRDGRPTEIGYKFVDACDRASDPVSYTPRKILGSCILNYGKLNAFLHYVHKLSEEAFSSNPLQFINNPSEEDYSFNRADYLTWLEDKMSNELKVMRKVAQRGGRSRRPFQAELAILRRYNYVADYRIGLGISINWPLIQEDLDFEF